MAVEAAVVGPQHLHPLPPPPATRPQSTNPNPRARATRLPLFQLCQESHHHHPQPWRRRPVPGKVTALVIRARLLTTALARMYVLMASVLFALGGRGVEGPVLLFPRRALHPLTTGSGSVFRVMWRKGC